MTITDDLTERIPPQNTEAERVVLATMLSYPKDIPAVEPMLQPADFYRPIHGLVYKAIISQWRNHEPIEPLPVYLAIEAAGEVEEYNITRQWFTDLWNDRGLITSEVATYGAKIKECAIRRQMIADADEQIRNAYRMDVDVEDTMTLAGSRLTAYTLIDKPRSSVASIGEYARQLYAEYYRAGTEQQPMGLRTGWESINGILRPFRPGQLIAVSADTGIGKTIWTINLAVDLAKHQHRGLIFSYEMRGQELSLRAALQQMNFTMDDLDDIHAHQYQDEVLNDLRYHADALKDMPLRIDEDAGNTVPMIERAIQAEIRQYGKIDFVVVDYIGLVPTAGQRNRYQELGEISRALKEMPKKYNLVMFVLCQLGTKRMSDRPCRRPQLDDVYESGRIPQDCDLFLALYWPGHYGATELKKAGYDPNDNLHWYISELSVLKSRAGIRGKDWRTSQRIEPEHVRYHDLTTAEWHKLPGEARPK